MYGRRPDLPHCPRCRHAHFHADRHLPSCEVAGFAREARPATGRSFHSVYLAPPRPGDDGRSHRLHRQSGIDGLVLGPASDLAALDGRGDRPSRRAAVGVDLPQSRDESHGHGRYESKAHVDNHGPYRWIRHPYTAVALAAVSNGLVAANWFVFLTGSLAFALLVIRCRTEEANLIARFGDAYRAYAVETGRFLPRLGRWGAGMMSLRRR